MTDTTPKVCPFCSNVPPKTIHETRFGEGYLQCACCEARGPTSFADALTAWNTRANADARLVEALKTARKIIADIDEYMKRPGRGDWGEECACCMGELLDDDRQAIAKIDAALSEVSQ
ncbi:hypothetical protein [Novosphingobium sp. B1]|uniref:hypothetical protein n=1 Tax=Novosphingobium sp. B1 TaxID=1938756 RepID=UPI0009D900CF|nr:hypothetical protein [Novosphingobium sp. B1]SMC45588.1 hypothetical protein SAMN06272759_10310 [Novosphingobium sp. B1]